MRRIWLFLTAGLFALGIGCNGTPSRSLTLTTGTTVRDSGLLDEVLPLFQMQTGIEVRVIAVGTGQALEIARRGDADAVLTHDPIGEERFIAEGFGTERIPIMSNDYVLVGPPDDPANLRDSKTGAEAFRVLSEGQTVFISRGDESGTHQMERAIWAAAETEPAGGWYVRSGQGMGAVLRMANEMKGYTLTDRGTFLTQRDRLLLAIVFAGDPTWVNRYAFIPVNPSKHPHVKHEAARRLADFLISDEVQQRIAEFGRAVYGEPLFRPNSRQAEAGP